MADIIAVIEQGNENIRGEIMKVLAVSGETTRKMEVDNAARDSKITEIGSAVKDLEKDLHMKIDSGYEVLQAQIDKKDRQILVLQNQNESLQNQMDSLLKAKKDTIDERGSWVDEREKRSSATLYDRFWGPSRLPSHGPSRLPLQDASYNLASQYQASQYQASPGPGPSRLRQQPARYQPYTSRR